MHFGGFRAAQIHTRLNLSHGPCCSRPCRAHRWCRVQDTRPSCKGSIELLNFPDSAHPRNVRAAAGLVVPDPATGTCLIHNICHIASTIIIILATVRNVPQILKCWRSRSAFGLSAAALSTEVTCYAFTVAYGVRRGYAITLWGSEMACWLQDATLLALVARLRGMRLPAISAICVGWMALKAVLFTDYMPMWLLSNFQIFVGLILGLGARVPQIILNHRNGHTGNLALATYMFNTTANLVCCTSTAVLTGDIYIMLKEAWMLTLNSTIVAQILSTQAKQRTAAAADLPSGAGSVTVASESFEESFRSRSRMVGLACGNHTGGAHTWSLSEVVNPDSRLDATAALQKQNVSSYSLDADQLKSLDEGSDSAPGVSKSGSMDHRTPTLAS